ncbi:MAG: cytochrome b/b6 domain-containing protein [Hyphomicrobiales bacterium]|nr:cytochrome b/b6 domain-containing protein [Hyphomicrobiales bacterium]
MGRRARPRTDIGTILMHWTLVALLTVSMLTGLRIATTSPYDLGWLELLDRVLPQTYVWTAHMPAAVGFLGLALAYVLYVRGAALTRRIRLDRIRLLALLRGGPGRWNAVNTIVTWLLFASLALQLATGILMYLGYGGQVAALHRLGTWVLLLLAGAHVATQCAIGGASQLMRMLRPKLLPPPAPPFDLFDLIATPQRPDVQDEPSLPLSSIPPRRQRNEHHAAGRTVVRSHPLAVATAIGIAGMTLLTVTDQAVMRDTLHVRRIDRSQAPRLDGDPSDPVWRKAAGIVVATNQGANFDGSGTSAIEIRAVHDGEIAYFSFIWDDPTRSLKHLPLVKTSDGWHVLHDNYDRGDEHSYHDDKLSVLLTRMDVLLAGDRTFHAGRAPADGKPATLSGRGLHYTPDGSIADVWQWRASREGLRGFIDDGHFGPPAEPTTAQLEGQAPYKGGYAADPGEASASDNFEPRGPGGYRKPVQPRRLPRDLEALRKAMGRIELDPTVGESDGARWWMTEAESSPYSPERDAEIPVGTVIPGVIIVGEHAGDRADIVGAARWLAGRWSLEAARRLDTGSRFDVPLATGVFLRVAAFDRSQIRHTRHIRPVRVEVE